MPGQSYLQNLFYRCQFSKIIDVINSKPQQPIFSETLIIKANAYFELHKVSQARDVLAEIMNQLPNDKTDEYLYVLAKLNYFDNNLRKSRDIFSDLYHSSSSDVYKFRALLGRANTLWSEKKFDELPKVIEELSSFEPLSRTDDKISLAIFLGNYHALVTLDSHLAKSFFHLALSLASKKSWLYFMARCFYGFAIVCEKDSLHDQLKWNLEILRSIIDENESRYFCHLVNTRFAGYGLSLGTFIEFDKTNRRIWIEGRWLDLSREPLLFKFLEILYDHDEFVPVPILKERLWPFDDKPLEESSYILETMAQKVRKLLERYEYQPVVLLHNSAKGYKLATA